ncbi:MAG TPA: phosphoribosyltransferase [Stellaceae bacterium]|jgi:putative phosphoribosyl transferase
MFADRSAAGRELSRRLQHLRAEQPIVLALPRGGVPVGFEIAEELDAPLDIVLVRKIGAPGQPELALGAVVDGAGAQVLIDEELAAALAVDPAYIEGETRRQLAEIERRREAYLGRRPPTPIAGRTAIVADDGIATGSTVRAALLATKRSSAGRVVLAVPVAPQETLAALRPEVDEIVCLATPSPFLAVGAHYQQFAQLADEDVVSLLRRRREKMTHSPGGPGE